MYLNRISALPKNPNMGNYQNWSVGFIIIHNIHICNFPKMLKIAWKPAKHGFQTINQVYLAGNTDFGNSFNIWGATRSSELINISLGGLLEVRNHPTVHNYSTIFYLHPYRPYIPYISSSPLVSHLVIPLLPASRGFLCQLSLCIFVHLAGGRRRRQRRRENTRFVWPK